MKTEIGSLAVLKLAAALGAVPVLAQTAVGLDSFGERLGAFAVASAMAFFTIKWFMREMSKKDDTIQRISAEHSKMQNDMTTLVIAELRQGFQVKQEMTAALMQLRNTLENLQPRARG